MSRATSGLVCSACGAAHAKWAGRCTACDGWNTLVDHTAPRLTGDVERLRDVRSDASEPRPTTISEVDRVLGGGLVPGSVTLLGGEPGIGKSTLLLQVLGCWPGPCLYVSAEENPHQVRVRADRLSLDTRSVWVTAHTTVPEILAAVDRIEPTLVVVDSIQTVSDPTVASLPGSIGQVRQCAQILVGEAKRRGVALVMIGHVTKDGAIAGPRVLEHVVDTVMSFEGDRHHALRLLRAVKHRFGATNELGLFEMTELGLVGVPDAARLFLADGSARRTGSVVVPALDGTRPLLVETQSLTIRSPPNAPARRTTQGLDAGRLAMLLAVLDRHGGFHLGGHDVYASTVGGVRLSEPGTDLAVAAAVASSLANSPVDARTVVIGELGLGGEVRHVVQPNRRLEEARRLGFERAVVPVATPAISGIELVRVCHISDALHVLGIDEPARRNRAAS